MKKVTISKDVWDWKGIELKIRYYKVGLFSSSNQNSPCPDIVCSVEGPHGYVDHRTYNLSGRNPVRRVFSFEELGIKVEAFFYLDYSPSVDALVKIHEKWMRPKKITKAVATFIYE